MIKRDEILKALKANLKAQRETRSYRIDKNIAEEFKVRCKKDGFSQTEVLEKLMSIYLGKNKT